MSRRITLLSFICLFFIQYSCKKKPAAENYSEGIVEFKITYLQDKVGGYSKSVLPKSMTIEFKDNKMKTRIEAALGFFRLIHITDLDDRRNTTLLKFMDKRYIFRGRKREQACCFGVLDDMKVTFTGRKKVIAGFQCEEAIAEFPSNEFQSFSIYFTREIGIRKPNVTSPYHDIPGFMMEFITTMGNAKMQMIAEKYRPVRIDDKEFEIPDDYRPVTRMEMENILHALME